MPAQLRALAATRRSAGAGGKVADILDAAAQRIADQDAQLRAANSYILRLLDRCDSLDQEIIRLRVGIALAESYRDAAAACNGIAAAEGALFAWLAAQERGS